MQTSQASLTITINPGDSTQQVFWNGTPVTGIIKGSIEFDTKEQEIKFRVNGTDDAIYMEMVSAGINIKKGK